MRIVKIMQENNNDEELVYSQPSDKGSIDLNSPPDQNPPAHQDYNGGQNMQSLFVIAEEEASQIYSEDMHSNYHNLHQYLELQGGARQGSANDSSKSFTVHSRYKDQIQKSKSLGYSLVRSSDQQLNKNSSNSDESD